MGEKRYYLTEVDEGTLVVSHFKLAITKAELKRRLGVIIFLGLPYHATDDDIHILLHGDSEKGDDLRSPYDTQIAEEGKYQTKLTPQESAQFEQAIGAEKAHAHMEQPDSATIINEVNYQAFPYDASHTPSRQEWEAWAERVTKELRAGTRMKNALLSMPIVPKE